MKNILLILIFLYLSSIPCSSNAKEKEIAIGWYHWDPYQYLNSNGNLTGLDYALIKSIYKKSGYDVYYDENAQDSWKDNQEDVLKGNKDAAAGAFITDYRLKNYHVSKPYRYEWNTLYIRTENIRILDTYLVDHLIEKLINKKYKLGVVKGYKYTSDKLNNYIEQQLLSPKSLIIEVSTDEENFENLKNREVDILLSDRLVGARILWKNKLGNIISEHPLKLPAKPIHLLIHKSDDPSREKRNLEILKAFNNGIDRLSNNGQITKTIGDYLFPVLMNITVQRDWFYLIDIIGAIFFAIAGVLIARDHRYDYFGTLVMTALLAAGGGVMRDLLVGRHPAILKYPDYIYIIVSVSIIGFTLCILHSHIQKKSHRYHRAANRHARHFSFLRTFIEAVALGAYTIIGVGVAVEMKVSPLWLWGPIFGCLTGCGGGILANALCKTDEMRAMRGAIDPETSLIWGIFFSQFLIWQTDRLNPKEVFIGVIITLVGATLTILIANKRKVTSPCIKVIKNIQGVSHER